jgi:hypothetical protein
VMYPSTTRGYLHRGKPPCGVVRTLLAFELTLLASTVIIHSKTTAAQPLRSRGPSEVVVADGVRMRKELAGPTRKLTYPQNPGVAVAIVRDYHPLVDVAVRKVV